MHGARTFLQDLALVFCVATVATLAFQRLRWPVVLGYLLAGLIVGPHVPIPLFANLERIELLSQLGVILVIFSIGLELRLDKLGKILPTSGIAAAVAIPAMLWIGYMIGRLAGFGGRESLFLGGAICISSTMIVARVLTDEDPRLTDSVYGVLIVQDLVAIVLIAVFTAIAGGSGMPAAEVFRIVGELLLFLLVAVVAGILVVPRLIREAFHRQNSEVLLVSAVGTCFGLALIAEHLGYSVALGAFIAGSVVAESGRRRQVEHLVAPLRDLFAAVFFVSIGMLVDPRALVDNWLMILVVSAAVLVGQSVFLTLGSFLSGRGVGLSVRTGMSLAQIGEFSFIIVGLGVAAGAVPSRLMAIAVGVAVVTTFATPYMVVLSKRGALAVERKLPHPLQTFIALHGAWIESLRGRRRTPMRATRRHLVRLLVDVVVLAGIIVALALGRDFMAHELAARTRLSLPAAGLCAVGAALVLALPFVIGFARNVRRLGIELATSVLPISGAGVDLADAPRRALVVAIELVVVLAAILPLVALTQPFLPMYAGAIVLAALAAGLGVVFWRSAANLQGHVRAGAELVLEVLNKQRHAEEDDHAAPALPALPELLPGLGPMISVRIDAAGPAVGRTLAELNLRALTGATVIALQHAGGAGVAAPRGHERLDAGDVISLTGSTQSIESARRLLAGEPPDAADAADAVEAPVTVDDFGPAP